MLSLFFRRHVLTILAREFALSVSFTELPAGGDCPSLAEIAAMLDVPAIVVTFCGHCAPSKHYDFGLGTQFDQSDLAYDLHRQCVRGAAIVPNIAFHPSLNKYADRLLARNLSFLTAVPLLDGNARHLGSISVFTSGTTRPPIEQLKALGHQFIAQLA